MPLVYNGQCSICNLMPAVYNGKWISNVYQPEGMKLHTIIHLLVSSIALSDVGVVMSSEGMRGRLARSEGWAGEG